MPELQQIDLGHITLRVAIEGEGPLVVMVHGFPESWYSWRHQIGPIAAAGFKACAIDVRGYGGSDKPEAVEAYAMEAIVGDLVALAGKLSPGQPAILVGHDWGAPIVWNSAFTHPERFRAVAGLSVPFTGAPKRPFTEVYEEHFTRKGLYFYQHYFQDEGVAEAELEADVRKFLLTMLVNTSGEAPDSAWKAKPVGAKFLDGMPVPGKLPGWLTEAELDYYTGEFERSGFRGPLNRYRNHVADYEWLKAWQGRTLDQPCLFIGGSRDPATSLFGTVADPVGLMRHFAPNVEGHILDGCGHWTQQERPAEVTALLVDWLKRQG